MKKIMLLALVVAVVLSFSSLSFAKSSPKITCAPTWVSCEPDADSVPLDWDLVEWGCPTPSKYSVEVELLIEGAFDDPSAVTQKLSFGTGAFPYETALDVPLSAFVYWDGLEYLPFYGDARARVKGLLTPGKSQNNTFSDWCTFTLTAPPTLK